MSCFVHCRLEIARTRGGTDPNARRADL